MTAPRPASVTTSEQPKDNGLFGPDSVTWRATAAPAIAVAAATASLVQMLHPRVMWMIDHASSFRKYPELRATRTGEYIVTITYGDTESAERAGAMLRYIHTTRKATDPVTGEQYSADEQDLLVWVHNALVWSMLRAYDRWGPKLSPADRDRFVSEQRTAARLVGIDPPEQAAGSVAELDAYMESMRPRLAFTSPAVWFRDMMAPRYPAPNAKGVASWLMTRAAVDLLTPEQRELYGIRWSRVDHVVADTAAKLILSGAAAKMPYEKLLPLMRMQSVVNAFGARFRRVIGKEQPASTTAKSPGP